MIFYNEINTRVERFSQILKDDWYVSRIPMLKFIRVKKKQKLVTFFNKITSGEDHDKRLIDDYYAQSLYIRILMFETLLKSLNHSPNDENKKLFKTLFHRDYDESLLPNIKTKIDRLIVQYEVIQSDTTDDKFDFDVFIKNISIILKQDLSNVFIYLLPVEIAKASEIIEKESKQHNKS